MSQRQPEQGGDEHGRPEELLQRLRELQGALTQLLTEAGAAEASSRSVAGRFGLSKNLVWRVNRVINAHEPAEIVKHLPGRAAMNRLLEAVGTSGDASQEQIHAVRHAIDELDRMIEHHAGDRATLEVMLGSTSDTWGAEAEASRKLAFRGNGAICGVQARVHLSLSVVNPSAGLDDGTIDVAMVSGLVDLRRLRRNTPWPLNRSRAYNDDGTVRGADRGSIDPVSGPTPLPFLTSFCSAPLPEVRAVERLSGEIEYELYPGRIGKVGAVTIIFGRVSRRFASVYRDERNESGEHVLYLTTPAEALVHDVLLHRSLPLPAAPEIAIYSQLMYQDSYPMGGRDRHRLPVNEPVVDLGAGPPIVATRLLPQHPALVQHVFDRLDWRLEEYRGYRFTMRYPPVPALAVMRYPLAEPPE